MASLSNCDLAHLPLFWTTPSTETCWLVVSFMSSSFLGLPRDEHTRTVTSPVRAWFRAASSLRRIHAGLEGNGPLWRPDDLRYGHRGDESNVFPQSTPDIPRTAAGTVRGLTCLL